MFDFSDVHDNDRSSFPPGLHRALVTAPTLTRLFCAPRAWEFMYARVCLDRIPEYRARAVSLEPLRNNATVSHSPNQPLLGRPVGRRQARTRAVLLHCGA